MKELNMMDYFFTEIRTVDKSGNPIFVTVPRTRRLSVAIASLLLASVLIALSLISWAKPGTPNKLVHHRITSDDGKRFGWNPMTRRNGFIDTATLKQYQYMKPVP